MNSVAPHRRRSRCDREGRSTAGRVAVATTLQATDVSSWLADVDSNHDSRLQRPPSCPWTICQWSGREDSNLHRPAPEAGGLPITLRPDELENGASGRIRTGRHRVGGPRSYRWTTLALVRPTGDFRSGRTWTGVVHRPIDIRQLSKTPLFRALSLVLPELATAPGFEPGPASFGDSDAPVTPRCRARLRRRQEPPCDLARASLRA